MAGGNAVDAALGAIFAASVAEQALTSLGGGGFLMVRHPDGRVQLRDFFVDTPGRGLPAEELDLHFLPMEVHFPGVSQTFHIGMGSVAVPGLLSGVLAAHDEFSRLPFDRIVAPAIRYAEQGVPMEAAQAGIFELTRKLVAHSAESRALIERDGKWLGPGDLIRNPDLARFLARVADGEVTSLASPAVAVPLLAAMEQGGLVTAADLDAYEVLAREPIRVMRAGHEVYTNSPPSFGGPIIAETLAGAPPLRPDDPASWARFMQALVSATAQARSSAPVVQHGTTHISVVDSDGMVASMTTSNGVTSGFVIPGTGIQLNNMLGEADLNPAGFHALPPGIRLGSMMSPTIMTRPDGSVVGLGTGGSERIRSALAEVLARLVDLDSPLLDAVAAGRIHHNDEGLQVEPMVDEGVRAALARSGLGPVNVWPAPGVYFGGVNAVERHPDGTVRAVADGRRGGAALAVAH